MPTTSAEVKAETSYILYDAKFRPIRTFTTNYLGGYTYTDSKLDTFSGQLQYTVQKHKRTGNDAELTVKEAFTYSPQKRLLTHTHQINGGTVQLLADNTYDELGKLTSKKVGNTSALPLQKVDYSYNIRGWLTKINDISNLQQGTDPADLFSFKLNYNTVDGSTGAADKLYNGNIAETFWSTATDGGFVRNYGYKYDSLNRLKDATYQKSNSVSHNYDENLIYDKNGNIVTLLRYTHNSDGQIGAMKMDELTYDYKSPTSNQLMKVTESPSGNVSQGFIDDNTTGDDYVYDANGNMTVDNNKHITSITYNHLNLPTQITFDTTGNIVYIYTASGQKVKKVVTSTTPANVVTTDYLGGYQYSNASLQFFPTAEGYVKNTPVSGTNSYSYVFNYTDHLGNTRLSYTKDTTTGSLKILEESNYYPFGLKHNSYNVDNFQPDYKYQYNGKEVQDELGLNSYDFGARNYDPALGRWMNIDPLAETSRKFSLYTYALNNPVYFIDPDGMEAKGADGLTNSEWLAANRESDSPTGQLDAEQKEFDKKQAEIDFYANKNKKKSIVTVGDAEVLDSGLNHAMYKMSEPDDIVRINTKDKTATVERTGDDYDRIFVNGKEVMATPRGALAGDLNDNGYSVSMKGPQGVGMGLTDFVLDAFNLITGAGELKMGITTISKASLGLKVGLGGSKATLKSSVFYTRTLGINASMPFRLPTIVGAPTKNFGLFLGRNASVFGGARMTAGGYGIFNNN